MRCASATRPTWTHPTGTPAIMRGGPAELYAEIPDELLVEAAVDEEHLRVIREVGLRSAMAVPCGSATRRWASSRS